MLTLIIVARNRSKEQTVNFTETVRYQIEGHLGSASIELNENAAITSYEEYHLSEDEASAKSCFGTTSYQKHNTGISQKRYKYVGKERDDETGLYYYGARYYAAWIGRWTATDPMANQRIWLNPYNYCQNNPINRTDPTGALDEDPPVAQVAATRESSAKGVVEPKWKPEVLDGKIYMMAGERATVGSLKEFFGGKEVAAKYLKEPEVLNLPDNVKLSGGVEFNKTNAFSKAVEDAYSTPDDFVDTFDGKGKFRLDDKYERLGGYPGMGGSYNCAYLVDNFTSCGEIGKWRSDYQTAALNKGSLVGYTELNVDGVVDELTEKGYHPVSEDEMEFGSSIVVFGKGGQNNHIGFYFGTDSKGNKYIFSKNGPYPTPSIDNQDNFDREKGGEHNYGSPTVILNKK